LRSANAEASTASQVNYYAKRWTIELSFRDTKDLQFSIGLGATRIGEPTRRDRLLLINAFAMVLLTMLGAAGESLGMDRLLKSNTSKIRTHSLFSLNSAVGIASVGRIGGICRDGATKPYDRCSPTG
jgi:hypothetical protein